MFHRVTDRVTMFLQALIERCGGYSTVYVGGFVDAVVCMLSRYDDDCMQRDYEASKSRGWTSKIAMISSDSFHHLALLFIVLVLDHQIVAHLHVMIKSRK